MEIFLCRWVWSKFSVLSRNTAHNRIWVSTDHNTLHGGHDSGLPSGCPGLHHPSLHGGLGLLQALQAKEQEQDNHLQQPSHHHNEKQEVVFNHQDWRSQGGQLCVRYSGEEM